VDLDGDNVSCFECDQRAKGNSKFFDIFMNTCAKIQDLVREITARQNQQMMPRALESWTYMATIYRGN
jgi:hypothetical protein